MLNHNTHHPHLLAELGDLCDFEASDTPPPSIHQMLDLKLDLNNKMIIKWLQIGHLFSDQF